VISVVVFALAIVATTVAESVISARNERSLRTAGAIEPDDDVYALMRIAYPGALVTLVAEGVLRSVHTDRWFTAGAILFVASKSLKYSAIAALGPRWTFRVLVPPASTRIHRGPYRWLSHPNYLAVAGELTGIALAMHAMITGIPAIAVFAALMWRRVRVEEKALAERRMRGC